MAIFFLKVKTIRRAAGRSATAAAAYRAGALIADQRSGQVFDYRRRAGVLATGLVGWDGSREALWNAAEVTEKRRDAVVGREVLVALPHELPRKAQIELLGEFAYWLRTEHRVAVDWCLHLPDSDGDARNVHGHILITARRVEAGRFAEKTLEFDRRPASRESVEAIRDEWANLANQILQQNGESDRLESRSYNRTLNAQGQIHRSQPQAILSNCTKRFNSLSRSLQLKALKVLPEFLEEAEKIIIDRSERDFP